MGMNNSYPGIRLESYIAKELSSEALTLGGLINVEKEC